jgi:hypothetical protein
MKYLLNCVLDTILLLLIIAFANLAHATDVTLTWTAPTQNSDKSTPPLIGGYNIYVAATDAALTALPNTIAGGKALSVGTVLTYTFKSVAPGTYFYGLTTWYCPRTSSVGNGCMESVQAAHISQVVSAPAIPLQPNPPANVTATAK